MARNDKADGGVAVLDPTASEDYTPEVSTNGANHDQPTQITSRKRGPKRNPEQVGPNEMISLNVRVPNALRALMAKTAVEQSTSVPQLVAKMVADAYSFTLPEPQRRVSAGKKYANEDERKAAQKREQERQRLVTRAVLKAIDEGKTNIDTEALKAEIDRQMAERDAKRAEEAQAASATSSASDGATEGAESEARAGVTNS